jgi:hypothetical protein
MTGLLRPIARRLRTDRRVLRPVVRQQLTRPSWRGAPPISTN